MSTGSLGTASDSTTSPVRRSVSNRWFHASPESRSWPVASPAEAASLTEKGSQAGFLNELMIEWAMIAQLTLKSSPVSTLHPVGVMLS